MFPALLLCGLDVVAVTPEIAGVVLACSSCPWVVCRVYTMPVAYSLTWPQLLLSVQCEKGLMLLGPWCIVGSSSAAASVFSMELTALCSLP